MANGGSRFKTTVYRQHADRTYGRMENTTLRETGDKRIFEKVNGTNKRVLRTHLKNRALYDERMEECEGNALAIWQAVKEAGGEKDSSAARVIDMSLGNPNIYEDFPPNESILESIREVMVPENYRRLSSYQASHGMPGLRRYLKRANYSDPASVNKDPGKFESEEVQVVLTIGGSQAAEVGMSPLLLKPEHTVVVHDWIYIIHLGAAYFRGANVATFDLADDGVPNPDSLRKTLHECSQNGKEVQCVVSTTIGNPIGSATPEKVVVDTLTSIKQHSEQEGRPIVAFFDTAYEAFRPNGKPLDPIEIAIDNGIEIPVGVFETASKGHGLCGWRLGALRMWWPRAFFSRVREDYLKCINNKGQPTLGVETVLNQMGMLRYFKMLETEPELMKKEIEFLTERRRKANANLLRIAKALRGIPGVYQARYYDHSGGFGDIDPNTLASFYFMYGYSKLMSYGAAFNQALWQTEFGFEHGLPAVKAVPGYSFLPEDRWAYHPGLIRVTGLTDKDDTDAFIELVAAAAQHLEAGRGKQVQVPAQV